MPTDADRDATTPEVTETVAEQPAPAQPTFALADVQTMISTAVREAVAANRPEPVRQVRQPEPEPEAPTEDDFRDNLPAAVAKTVARALHPLRQEMGAFRQFGLERLSDLNENVHGAQLPHYREFKGEIDARLATLAPEIRVQPQTLQLVHDTVVASHLPELQERARQEGIRQARGDAPQPPKSGINGRQKPDAPDTPTPEELGFNEDQIGDINARGGPDAFAQRISGGRYKDWAAYAASKQGMDAQPRTSKGRVMPFRRLEPGKRQSA
jgi:hypothetical protein